MHGCISYEFTTPGQICTLNSNSQPAQGVYKRRDVCVKEFFEDTIVVSGGQNVVEDTIIVAGGYTQRNLEYGPTKETEVLFDQNCALPELPFHSSGNTLVLAHDLNGKKVLQIIK